MLKAFVKTATKIYRQNFDAEELERKRVRDAQRELLRFLWDADPATLPKGLQKVLKAHADVFWRIPEPGELSEWLRNDTDPVPYRH